MTDNNIAPFTSINFSLNFSTPRNLRDLLLIVSKNKAADESAAFLF
ncbi:MAG: hypothetical protein M3209_03885 [Acidobacteriota bacterium]|nr:hypothetical protein [Acidobacteriota bacterium]